VRITAQLVEASTRNSDWAKRYDRQMDDVFAIQEEIARSIAQALRITLTPQEEKTIARKSTESPQAYDFYLRGRSYTRRENMDYALQMFEQAIQLDPNFALAHGGIAHLCGLIYEVREQNPKWIESTVSLGKRQRRSRRSRRRLRPDTATRIGRPMIPISIACTTTLNSRNWSAEAKAPRYRKYYSPTFDPRRPT
jgi:tetratricopeptide (TPR) repeat protein